MAIIPVANVEALYAAANKKFAEFGNVVPPPVELVKCPTARAAGVLLQDMGAQLGIDGLTVNLSALDGAQVLDGVALDALLDKAYAILQANAGGNGEVMIVAVDGTATANVWEGKVSDILAGTVSARAVTLVEAANNVTVCGDKIITFYNATSGTITVRVYDKSVSHLRNVTWSNSYEGVMACASFPDSGRVSAIDSAGNLFVWYDVNTTETRSFGLPTGRPPLSFIGSVDFTSNGYCIASLGTTEGYLWIGTPGFTSALNFTKIASGTSAPQTIAVGKDNVAVGINSNKQVIRYSNIESSTSGTTVATLSELATPARICGDKKVGGFWAVNQLDQTRGTPFYESSDNGLVFHPYTERHGSVGVTSVTHSDKNKIWILTRNIDYPYVVTNEELATNSFGRNLVPTKPYTTKWTSAAIMDL